MKLKSLLILSFIASMSACTDVDEMSFANEEKEIETAEETNMFDESEAQKEFAIILSQAVS